MYEEERRRSKDSASGVALLASAYGSSPDQVRSRALGRAGAGPANGIPHRWGWFWEFFPTSSHTGQPPPPLPPPNGFSPGLELFHRKHLWSGPSNKAGSAFGKHYELLGISSIAADRSSMRLLVAGLWWGGKESHTLLASDCATVRADQLETWTPPSDHKIEGRLRPPASCLVCFKYAENQVRVFGAAYGVEHA